MTDPNRQPGDPADDAGWVTSPIGPYFTGRPETPAPLAPHAATARAAATVRRVVTAHAAAIRAEQDASGAETAP